MASGQRPQSYQYCGAPWSHKLPCNRHIQYTVHPSGYVQERCPARRQVRANCTRAEVGVDETGKLLPLPTCQPTTSPYAAQLPNQPQMPSLTRKGFYPAQRAGLLGRSERGGDVRLMGVGDLDSYISVLTGYLPNRAPSALVNWQTKFGRSSRPAPPHSVDRPKRQSTSWRFGISSRGVPAGQRFL